MQLPSSVNLPIMHTFAHESWYRDVTRRSISQRQAVASASFCTVELSLQVQISGSNNINPELQQP